MHIELYRWEGLMVSGVAQARGQAKRVSGTANINTIACRNPLVAQLSPQKFTFALT